MKRSYEPYVIADDCGSIMKFTVSNCTPPHGRTYDLIECEDGTYSKEFYKTKKGMLKRFERSTRKADNLDSLKRSFGRLRDIINTNFTDNQNMLFITLTYAGLPTIERVSRDMREFTSKLRKESGLELRYVYVVEKQGREAWHTHTIVFFDCPAPYISDTMMNGCWGKGFWQITRFRDSDSYRNVGAYLCCYLTDAQTEHGRIKNERLMNYESGVHLYRCSKNIQRPTKYSGVPYQTYRNYVEEHEQVYSKTLETEYCKYEYEHYRTA